MEIGHILTTSSCKFCNLFYKLIIVFCACQHDNTIITTCKLAFVSQSKFQWLAQHLPKAFDTRTQAHYCCDPILLNFFELSEL